MKDIKLVALDLDGTLFDNSSRISERNLTAIPPLLYFNQCYFYYHNT